MKLASPALLRRSLLAGSLGTAASSACRPAARCAHCGMVLDPASRWRAELRTESGSVRRFDTPKCAFAHWRHHEQASVALFAMGYYTQEQLPASALQFAVGSDVSGPMGPDLVPVERAESEKFAADHHAKAMLPVEAVTSAMIDSLI